jgi:hypothetical protein
VRRIAGGVGYDLPQWTILALWLAEQRHLARCDGGGGGGGSSRWGPYLAVLPDAAGTVLDWKEGEVSGAHRRYEACSPSLLYEESPCRTVAAECAPPASDALV